MLVIAPRFDEVTEYSRRWVERLLDELSIEVEKLFDADATRVNFERRVGEHSLIVFYDHGDRAGLLEQGGKGYVIDKGNAHLLKGREIYTLACLWCSDGGVDAWRKGARVVWGYVKEFVFTIEEEELFMECANYGLVVRFKEGVSWEEAFERAIEKFNEAIGRARDGWSKVWLRYDRDALVCYTRSRPPMRSSCPLRNMLIRVLGAGIAWKVEFREVIGFMMMWIGYGVALHDYIHQVWELRGTIFSVEGGYIGFLIWVIGAFIFVQEMFRSITRVE